jgi:hypothetical protein
LDKVAAAVLARPSVEDANGLETLAKRAWFPKTRLISRLTLSIRIIPLTSTSN